MPISTLRDSVIGIDAAYYLEGPAKEPLVSALGGSPLALETSIVRELKDWEAVGIRPHFVFDGLDDGINDNPFGPSVVSARSNATAFETYDSDEAEQAIELFRTSGTPTPAALSSFLKKLLHNHGIPFTVAPYSALAQLAYFEKHPSHFVDAIYGSSELFLYGVDKIITKFKLSYQPFIDSKLGHARQISQFVPEQSEFQRIDQRACLEELGRIPSGLFIDALLLAGSKALGQFPAFKGKSYTIRDVVHLLASYGRSVVNLCNQYPEDEQVPRATYLNYLDQFKRALTGIRHHVVITVEGDIEALDKEIAPSDLHYCVGQRLPEELNMYLSRGLVQPRVLNWLASGTILMLAPYEGGDSQVYQNLIQVQLEPIRKQALSLLADSVHRYYQRKEITTKYWFDITSETKFNIKDLLPSPKSSISAWNVQEDALLDRLHAMGGSSDLPIGSLSFAIRSLRDLGFARATITPRSKDGQQILKSRDEICANAVWRFLQLRGYVDDQHQLTKWGNLLDSMLSGVGHGSDWERLPLFDEDSCALGVATLTYLDELSSRPDPTLEATRRETRERTQGWVKHCNFQLSQQHAYQLWNAVSASLLPIELELTRAAPGV
ncbi:MAG: hypothetical protein L6R35_001173 [Caloplaca aegaea]|nr:MAG: hypothetical protein L6R35_001173 [Caloplaca aegaea]